MVKKLNKTLRKEEVSHQESKHKGDNRILTRCTPYDIADRILCCSAFRKGVCVIDKYDSAYSDNEWDCESGHLFNSIFK